MELQKMVLLRLFFNLSNRTFYIVIGNCLCPIRDKLCAAIQEREQIEIIHATDIKEIQELTNKTFSYESNSIHY